MLKFYFSVLVSVDGAIRIVSDEFSVALLNPSSELYRRKDEKYSKMVRIKLYILLCPRGMGETQIYGKIAPFKSRFVHLSFCFVLFMSRFFRARFSPFINWDLNQIQQNSSCLKKRSLVLFCSISSCSSAIIHSGNTKGGSITVPLTSCLTSLDQSLLQIKTKNFSCHTADSKPVKQEVNGTVILPPLVFSDSPISSVPGAQYYETGERDI